MIENNWGRSLTGKQLFCKQLIEGSIPSASIENKAVRSATSSRYLLTCRFFYSHRLGDGRNA